MPFSLEIHLGNSILLGAVHHPHILCFGLIVSDLPGGVLSLFLYFFSSVLFCINNIGRGLGVGGEGNLNSAGAFPNQFIIINFPMLSPSLKTSWFIIGHEIKRNPLFGIKGIFVSVKTAAFCSKFHI